MSFSKPGTTSIIYILTLTCSVAIGQQPSLKQLYDQHRWFELREAIRSSDAPILYKGAVAAAFNDRKTAEKNLNATVKTQPGSASAEDAHEILATLYIRSGKYHEAVEQLDEALKINPENSDAKNSRVLFSTWGKHPNQAIGTKKSARVHADVSKDGVKLAMSIHGKTVHWLLDTGANFSVMSDSEAKMLGVTIDESEASVADSAGGSTRMRTAVVDDLAIGETHIRNVPFLILPDSQEPMSEWPPGERGLIGIQIPIALQTIRWTSDGTFEMQPRLRRAKGDQNLSFDGLNPVTRGEFDGREIDCVLDSGDQSGSQFWGRFARDFEGFVKQHGTKSTQRVEMVGGANLRETIVLPQIRLIVGGLDTALLSAQVYAKPVGDEFHHGLLGLDMLSQAKEVRIDFRSMTLQLLP